MFFLEIEKHMIFLFFSRNFFHLKFLGVGFEPVKEGWGPRGGGPGTPIHTPTQPAHEFPVSQPSAACYRRSFPFRWIFKIFPSLCLAVAIPFFSRLALASAAPRRSPLARLLLLLLLLVVVLVVVVTTERWRRGWNSTPNYSNCN